MAQYGIMTKKTLPNPILSLANGWVPLTVWARPWAIGFWLIMESKLLLR